MVSSSKFLKDIFQITSFYGSKKPQNHQMVVLINHKFSNTTKPPRV